MKLSVEWNMLVYTDHLLEVMDERIQVDDLTN